MSEYLHLQAFRIQKLLLTLAGIWPKENYGNWYKIYGFFMSLVLQGVFIMPSLVQVLSQSTDVAHGSYILFSTLTMFTYGIKLIVLYIKRNTFYGILQDLEQPLFKYQSCFEIYMKDAVWVSNTTRKLIQFPIIIFIIFIAAFPALDDIDSSERLLPYDIPINSSELPFFVYAIVYFLQILAAAVGACNNANMDTLACSFMALGTAQLRILKENLKISAIAASSGPASRKSKRNDQNLQNYGNYDEEVAENIKKCAKHHIAINNYVEKLEETFTYMFLAQFLSSLVVICIAGFSFLVIPVSNVLFGASLSYFAAVMIEISIFCLFGDELTIQSLKISDACYMSEWNNCGPEIRKTLLIMMEKSKRPLELTAGKFVTLSRESLVTLCKSSFSYFAVLRKMYSGKQ